MPCNDQHPEYIAAKPRYKLIRDIINNTAMCHLRKPDPEDECRNTQYQEDAVLTNFTKLTCEGLTGLVFRKKLKVSLPPELNYLLDDVTGSGINLYQFAQYCVSETIKMGRIGLLVDYHNDAQKAYLKPYKAEAIINWKAKLVNGVVQPWLIVLLEDRVLDTKDIFSQECEPQYRVLILENGVYYQMIYNAKTELESAFTPLDFNGQPFDYIPFQFIGSENNDWAVDQQPIYDLAVLNKTHYQDSADYQESIFLSGQPYLVVNVGESTPDSFREANPNGVAFGSRKCLTLASGGNAQLLQANANQLVAQAMREILEQAAKIGARLIEEAGGRETATGAQIRYGSQHSALYILTSNVSWGVADALIMLCKFMGANSDIINFLLNDQFYEESADPNLIAQQIMLLDRGVISIEDIRDYGRKTGFISDERTDEDIENDVDLNLDVLASINDNISGSDTSTPASTNETSTLPGQSN